MQGEVAPDGSVVIVFTEPDGSDPVVGLGQMKTIDGQPAMLMQMITGTDFLVTHWAYMLTYDPSTFTPPPPQAIPVTLLVAGMDVDRGHAVADGRSGAVRQQRARHLRHHRLCERLFLGQGHRPGRRRHLYRCSARSRLDGKVLYNAIADGELVSLYGDIRGATPMPPAWSFPATSTSGIDDSPPSLISLVSPYADTVRRGAGLGASCRRPRCSTTSPARRPALLMARWRRRRRR